MITICKYCGVDLEIDTEEYENGDELQTTCPECGRNFDFVVRKDDGKSLSSYYYLNNNNEQNGPLPIKELINVISSSTLVWKEGMSDWKKACEIEELRTQMKSIEPPPIPVSSPPPIKTFEVSTTQAEETEYQPIKPDTNMTIAILCTLFCCIPLGVCAIYYAAKVDKSYYQGEYYEAEQFSDKAKNWSYWGIGLGIFLDILYYVVYL